MTWKAQFFGLVLLLLFTFTGCFTFYDTPPTSVSLLPEQGVSVPVSGAVLSWSHEESLDKFVTYHVFLDLTNPPKKLWESVSENPSIFTGALMPDTIYYWYVVATIDGVNSISEVNSFRTESQGDTFNGNLILDSQEDINEFGSKGYSHVNGRLTIYTGAIDLTPLSLLKSVSGGLNINSPDLLTLDGLENLRTLGEISIVTCRKLNSLTPLLNLRLINGDAKFSSNDELTTFNGLQNAIITGDIIVENHRNLTSFCAFSNVVENSIAESFTAFGNKFNPTENDMLEGKCATNQ